MNTFNTHRCQYLLLLLICVLPLISSAQNAIGINNDNPDSSAILDVVSTNKGILIPRMTTAMRDAISNPANGLLVFDSTTNTFSFFNSAAWRPIPSDGSFSNGDSLVLRDTSGNLSFVLNPNARQFRAIRNDSDRVLIDFIGPPTQTITNNFTRRVFHPITLDTSIVEQTPTKVNFTCQSTTHAFDTSGISTSRPLYGNNYKCSAGFDPSANFVIKAQIDTSNADSTMITLDLFNNQVQIDNPLFATQGITSAGNLSMAADSVTRQNPFSGPGEDFVFKGSDAANVANGDGGDITFVPGTKLGTGTDGKVVINGDVVITGNISKGSGTFRIDHPLDPYNKYLYHSFVESPDMMNVYNGNVTTNEKGEAVVSMPDYFDALNRDFRYQLTTIGRQSDAWIGAELEEGKFTINTEYPNVKVSWQVTGIRQDPYARENPVEVEVDKEPKMQGKLLFEPAKAMK